MPAQQKPVQQSLLALQASPLAKHDSQHCGRPLIVQQALFGGAQQVVLQPRVVGGKQQVVAAQPWAGGSHRWPSHEFTSALQTPLKQFPVQQSPSCVQATPRSLAQWLTSAQQTVPAGQLSALHWHWPWVVQLVPGGQATHCAPPKPHKSLRLPATSQKPGLPGPFGQHPSGQVCALHWHLPWSHWPWKGSQVTQAAPPTPHAPSSVPGWHC